MLFAYDDPNPIDAGQIALWTYNNGIMLSRVQIFHENEVKPNFLMVRSTSSQPAAPARKANPAIPAKVAAATAQQRVR